MSSHWVVDACLVSDVPARRAAARDPNAVHRDENGGTPASPLVSRSSRSSCGPSRPLGAPRDRDRQGRSATPVSASSSAGYLVRRAVPRRGVVTGSAGHCSGQAEPDRKLAVSTLPSCERRRARAIPLIESRWRFAGHFRSRA